MNEGIKLDLRFSIIYQCNIAKFPKIRNFSKIILKLKKTGFFKPLVICLKIKLNLKFHLQEINQ